MDMARREDTAVQAGISNNVVETNGAVPLRRLSPPHLNRPGYTGDSLV
jgi:hypothetical protein